MVPPGPPTPLGGGQQVQASLIRSNSGYLTGQGGPNSNSLPSQSGFPSLISPRNQFNNMNMLGNMPNVSSLLHQSFGNGGGQTAGNSHAGAESDPLSGAGNGMGFNNSSPFGQSNMVNGLSGLNTNSSSQQFDQQQQQQSSSQQQIDQQQSFQQQFSSLNNNHQQYHQGNSLQNMNRSVKMEPQMSNDHHGLRSLGPVKMEPQQMQGMRNLGPVKMEPQQSDQSLFLHQQQQQQQQQFLQMSRQNPQAAAAAQINLLHQQRLLQLQHQQQQLLKSQQRSSIQPQFQSQNLPLRSPAKPVYEPGMCARRLTHYMYQQQHRPEDNNIEFWRKFVAEYFAPNAKKKWCVSMYGSGRQTTGVFPQDVWHCEICNRKPGRGFEATAEVLPRLFKIKYESGTLEELLYVDMPREYQNSSGQIVLDYAKAIQESVFEQLRVVRDGQLRIVFSPDLKICSWEFCARRHEELIPRRLLIPQVSQLGTAAQKYQTATQNANSNLSATELQSNCNMFVASARQLAKALEVPLVNDLGYTKRYVRCLQISEVVNSMKDLIDYSRETGTGPMESLTKYPRRTDSGFRSHPQQPDEQPHLQSVSQNTNNDNNNSVQAAVMQLASTHGTPSVNNPSTSGSTIAGLLNHQNSMNSRHHQIPSPGPPFQSPPTPSSSNNPNSCLTSTAQMNSASSPNVSILQPDGSGDPSDPSDSQSSVQKIIHEMMMSSQLNGGAGGGMVNEPKIQNNMMSMNGMNGMRGSMGMNGRVNMSISRDQSSNHQQHDLGNQLLGAGNGFNNLQFDWKPSP